MASITLGGNPILTSGELPVKKVWKQPNLN
jgi:hypothetical protein